MLHVYTIHTTRMRTFLATLLTRCAPHHRQPSTGVHFSFSFTTLFSFPKCLSSVRFEVFFFYSQNAEGLKQWLCSTRRVCNRIRRYRKTDRERERGHIEYQQKKFCCIRHWFVLLNSTIRQQKTNFYADFIWKDWMSSRHCSAKQLFVSYSKTLHSLPRWYAIVWRHRSIN